jgi:outer membrane PBP1 activator LpoA protein
MRRRMSRWSWRLRIDFNELSLFLVFSFKVKGVGGSLVANPVFFF